MIVKAQTQTLSHTFVFENSVVHVPGWVVDLASFRQWYYSDEFPEEGRICYFKREVWIDMSKEQLFFHNKAKTELSRVLATLVKVDHLGYFFSDGLRLTNEGADLSSVPDGTFFPREALQTGRVRFVEGAEEGYVELEGTPDLVIEVLSPGSVAKDKGWQREAYWKAGIPEYWLVDVRGERLEFDILRHGPKGYTPVRKQGGWVKSKILGKSFRSTRAVDDLGHPDYTLEMQ